MSIRKIIFCDICNPRGLRSVEFRRTLRENESVGQRICDGRAWIEGETIHAVKNGWLYTQDGQHICPACKNRHLERWDTNPNTLWRGLLGFLASLWAALIASLTALKWPRRL